MISRKNHIDEKRGPERVTFKTKRFKVEPMYKHQGASGYQRGQKEPR
jgi:hypothetical protein